MLKTINPDNINTLAKCGFFHNDANAGDVTKNYVAATFTTATNIEHVLKPQIKSHGADICFPLLLDSSTLEMYLLDRVDLRIRLEMANKEWLLNSDGDLAGVFINVSKAKLWVDRVIPHYNAMTALNHALATKPIEYVFQKTLHKTYVIGAGENSIMIDQPFGMVIPERMILLIVDMNSFSGSTSQNGLYFEHCNISNLHMTVNGNTLYNINTNFPENSYSQSYYETIKSLGLDNDHMITFDAYKAGRSIFGFNFINEPAGETLPIETTARLRLNLKLSQNLASPHVIILLAETTGLLTIDNQRMVTCDVRG